MLWFGFSHLQFDRSDCSNPPHTKATATGFSDPAPAGRSERIPDRRQRAPGSQDGPVRPYLEGFEKLGLAAGQLPVRGVFPSREDHPLKWSGQ